MNYKQLLGTFFILIVLLVSSCSEKKEPPPGQNAGSVPAQEQSLSGKHDLFPLSIVDSAGRVTVLPALPERFVVLGKVGHGPYMASHLLYMFPETVSRLVGVEQLDKSSDFLAIIDPRFSEKKILQINASAEQIAALKPDVVFMKGTVADAMATVLEQVNIPLVYLGLEDPEQFLHGVSLVGDILDDKARAEEICTFYRTRLKMIHDRVNVVCEEKKPRVLVLGYNAKGGAAAVQVPAASWMQTLQVTIAGGRPVWVEEAGMTNGWTVVSFEQIAAWNPDKIFIAPLYRADPSAIIDKLKKDPQWSRLKAVKNAELHTYPSDLFPWDTPGPRWILGTMWMAAQLQPDLFDDIDMKQEVYHFFEELFYMPRERIDSKIMPLIIKTSGGIDG